MSTNAFRSKQSESLVQPDQEITVVYQRPGIPRPEIQLFPVRTKDVENHQQAYSRFKSAICRLFELPKSTPFMLKDQVTGVKMTRDRYSDYLTTGRFPVVWKLVTALPGEEGAKRSLVQLNSTASIVSGATISSDTSDKQRSKSVSIDTPSLHSLSRTLSLGWSEHTNTYGLETQFINVGEKQLVFISKRTQSLTLCSLQSSQSDLSVGDVILKIEGRPVGEMSRDEIGLHLNYPQAQLASLTLSVVPWTQAPAEIKEVILKALGSDLSYSTAVPKLPSADDDFTLINHSPRLPTTKSNPNFHSIPISPIDCPRQPQPIKSPDPSPRRKKNRLLHSIGSPGEAGLSPAQKSAPSYSPSKVMGFLSGSRSRSRNSCTRSESFAFIPSFPDNASIPESPNDCTFETNRSADCVLEPNGSADLKLEPNGSADFKLEPNRSADLKLEPNGSADLKLEPSQAPIIRREHNLSADCILEATERAGLKIEYKSADSLLEPFSSFDVNWEDPFSPLCTKPEPTDRFPQARPEPTTPPYPPPEPSMEPNLKPEPSMEPNLKPEPNLEPNLKPEPNVEPNLKPETSFEPNLKPEPSMEPTPKLEPNLKPEPSMEPNPKPEPNLEPEPNMEPNFKPEVTPSLESADLNPELTIRPNIVLERSADLNPELTIRPNIELERSADLNPELTTTPNMESVLELSECFNPELTIVPSSNPDFASKLRIASDLNPELTLSPPSLPQTPLLDMEPNMEPNMEPFPPSLEQELSALTTDSLTGSNSFRRTLSDPNSDAIFPAHSRLSSNTDLDTEDFSGMFYITDPPPAEATGSFQLGSHPFHPLVDPSTPSIDSNYGRKGVKRPSATEFPRVTDGRETVVASSCTEFVNPAFQGSVHGVYHSFDSDQSTPAQLPDTGQEIVYYDYSSGESDYEDSAPRRQPVEPAGLATPLRPRKFPSYNPDPGDMRPTSEIIQRSTSEATNLAKSARFFKDTVEAGNVPRIRMARKKKALVYSVQRADSNLEFSDDESKLGSPSAGVPNGRGNLSDKAANPKPAEFVHPAYRQYRQIGNMEINERMCAKLREKFQPINSGPLSRKQETDGRLRKRAADRSWKNFYVRLLESDLIFYKSERDYLSDKPFLPLLFTDTCERHFCYDHIVSLHHASLLIPNDYMSQKRSCASYVFRLQTENTSSYLMRAVSLPLMFGWLLSFIEARILPPTDNPCPIGLFQEPDKRRFSSIEGANRYFQRIHQKVRSKLNFTRRDSEVAPDPIFSTCINSCARSHDNEKLPLLVEMCVREIEERGLESDGIYRVSGTARHIRSLRDDLSKGVEIDRTDERWLDENNVAGLLKLFFKELSEPLVNPLLYDSLVTEVTARHESQGQLIRSLQQLLQSMPETNYCTLDYLVAHVCRVAQFVAKNRMSIKNLAIVFGPTLITRRDLKGIQLICQTNAQVTVMEQLITHYDHIFNCRPIPEFLFESKRTPSMVSRRSTRNSISNMSSDKFRRVSSTDPPVPLPSLSPPPPYPDHVPLEAKLSRSWSEEVLTRVNLALDGSDLDGNSPLNTYGSNSLHESNALIRRSSIGSRESLPHPLSNTLWHIPFDNSHSDPVTPFPERSARMPTFL